MLLVSPAAINKSAELFVEPEQWGPDRWMSGSLRERVGNGQAVATASLRNNFLLFGVGKNRCIGDEFSYVQLTTILSVVVRELKLKNPEGGTSVPATNYAVCLSILCHIIARCFSWGKWLTREHGKSPSSLPVTPANVVWQRRGSCRKTSM